MCFGSFQCNVSTVDQDHNCCAKVTQKRTEHSFIHHHKLKSVQNDNNPIHQQIISERDFAALAQKLLRDLLVHELCRCRIVQPHKLVKATSRNLSAQKFLHKYGLADAHSPRNQNMTG